MKPHATIYYHRRRGSPANSNECSQKKTGHFYGPARLINKPKHHLLLVWRLRCVRDRGGVPNKIKFEFYLLRPSI